MKIGVLTFHCAHNYGAMLQTYATQELLRAAGHEVEIIDYRPSYLTEPFKRVRWSRIRKVDGSFSISHLIAEMILLPFRFVRYGAFDRFMRRRLNLSQRTDLESFKGNYDVIVFGSDQVWNIRQTGGDFDRMYLGDFNFEKGLRKYIADAVSMETDLMGESQIGYLKRVLPGFDALSAREASIAEWLESHTDLKVEHIQDPVLQLSPEKWKELAKPIAARKPYLLLYSMIHDARIRPFAEAIAKQQYAETFGQRAAVFIGQCAANLRLGGRRIGYCHKRLLSWILDFADLTYQIRTSGSSRIPNFSYTMSDTCCRSRCTSSALALPRFTTNPACFSETAASPTR